MASPRKGSAPGMGSSRTRPLDRKSTRLNSSHSQISYAAFCLNKKRFVTVLDSISAALARQSYISQVISVRSIGESTFVSPDRQTTFLIAALTPASTSDVSRTVVPDLRETVTSTLQRLPLVDGFDVKVTGNPALDYDVRTISAEDTRHGEQRALPLTLAG